MFQFCTCRGPVGTPSGRQEASGWRSGEAERRFHTGSSWAGFRTLHRAAEPDFRPCVQQGEEVPPGGGG